MTRFWHLQPPRGGAANLSGSEQKMQALRTTVVAPRVAGESSERENGAADVTRPTPPPHLAAMFRLAARRAPPFLSTFLAANGARVLDPSDRGGRAEP